MSAMRYALVTLAVMAAGSAATADRPMTPLSAKAEKALAGRTPGKPVSCLSLPTINSSTIVDDTAIIYKVSNRPWYVNRPDNGSCQALHPNRTLVTISR